MLPVHMIFVHSLSRTVQHHRKKGRSEVKRVLRLRAIDRECLSEDVRGHASSCGLHGESLGGAVLRFPVARMIGGSMTVDLLREVCVCVDDVADGEAWAF